MSHNYFNLKVRKFFNIKSFEDNLNIEKYIKYEKKFEICMLYLKIFNK